MWEDMSILELSIIAAIVAIVGWLVFFAESSHTMCVRLCTENQARDLGTCVTTCEVAANAADWGAAAAGIAASSRAR